MDNFRKYTDKSSEPRKPKRSIDGFISNNQKPIDSSTNLKRGQYYQPQANSDELITDSVNLDNFNQNEGFTSSTAQVEVETKRTQTGRRSPLKMGGRFTSRGNYIPGKKAKKPQKKWKRVLKRTSTAAALILVLGAGFIFGKAWWEANRVFKGGGGAAALDRNVDPSRLRVEGDGRINIIILGKGGPGHDGADLTDTILVASIDPMHKEAGLLSVPRDLYVKVPGNGSSKINAVYANAKNAALAKNAKDEKGAEKAGIDAVERTVEDSMGIPIHYYSMIDFEAFREAVDTVGGVTIDVKEKLYDPSVAWENNNNPLIADVGVQTFNGKKALLYARSRLGSTRGDFDRAERQKEIMLALKDKVLNLGTFGNPLKISQLLGSFGSHVQTNLSIDEINQLYNITKDIPQDKIKTIGLANPPNVLVKTGSYAGQSVVMPVAGIFNYSEIQNFVRNELKDPFIRSENASILILNGTNIPGLATNKSDELKSYGYNVMQVGEAPTKNYSQTQLIDLRGGQKKYTRHYLELRLKTNAIEKLPGGVNPGMADFVIIIGQNEAPNS